jgi:hypothetical protein
MVETVIVPGISALLASFLSPPGWAERTDLSPTGEEPQLRLKVPRVDIGKEGDGGGEGLTRIVLPAGAVMKIGQVVPESGLPMTMPGSLRDGDGLFDELDRTTGVPVLG